MSIKVEDYIKIGRVRTMKNTTKQLTAKTSHIVILAGAMITTALSSHDASARRLIPNAPSVEVRLEALRALQHSARHTTSSAPVSARVPFQPAQSYTPPVVKTPTIPTPAPAPIAAAPAIQPPSPVTIPAKKKPVTLTKPIKKSPTVSAKKVILPPEPQKKPELPAPDLSPSALVTPSSATDTKDHEEQYPPIVKAAPDNELEIIEESPSQSVDTLDMTLGDIESESENTSEAPTPAVEALPELPEKDELDELPPLKEPIKSDIQSDNKEALQEILPEPELEEFVLDKTTKEVKKPTPVVPSEPVPLEELPALPEMSDLTEPADDKKEAIPSPEKPDDLTTSNVEEESAAKNDDDDAILEQLESLQDEVVEAPTDSAPELPEPVVSPPIQTETKELKEDELSSKPEEVTPDTIPSIPEVPSSDTPKKEVAPEVPVVKQEEKEEKKGMFPNLFSGFSSFLGGNKKETTTTPPAIPTEKESVMPTDSPC
jgi:chemotaxis protein histidine kinase CheA